MGPPPNEDVLLRRAGFLRSLGDVALVGSIASKLACLVSKSEAVVIL